MDTLPYALLLVVALIAAGLLAAAAAHLRHRLRQERASNSNLQEALAASQMLFDSNPNPMYVYDVDTFTILSVNQTLCERYGYAPEDLVGQSLMNLHIEAERGKLREVIEGLRETRDPNFRYRWLQQKKSGAAIPVEIFWGFGFSGVQTLI